LGKVGLSFTLFDKTYALNCNFHREKKGGPFSIKARFLYTKEDTTLNRDAFEVLGIQLDDKKRTLTFRLPESIANNIQRLTIGTIVTRSLNGTRIKDIKDIVFKVDSLTP
jgi:hypothetical protein